MVIKYTNKSISDIRQGINQQVEIETIKDNLSEAQKQIKENSTNTVTDEIGNVYKQEIQTDGTVSLVLIESYTGELFE